MKDNMEANRKESTISLARRRALEEWMDESASDDVVVAFSGGADSSLVLKLACEAARKQGTRVYAVTVHTALHPVGDLEVARQVAGETGAIHRVIAVDELAAAGITENPEDRCYRCKHYLFSRLKELARELGAPVVMDGTNADDLKVYRPGIRALAELGIASPLKEAGFTKAEVRALAGEYGITVADRPAAPCLATRFPYGTHLTREAMERVEAAEDYLKTFGFYNVRLRVHGDVARIEVDEAALSVVLENRRAITGHLKGLGYRFVTLDLDGYRSGSYDGD